MAIGVLIEFDGVTADQYDAVQAHLGLGDRTPPGAIFHVAGPTDTGWRVVDVWESPEAFDNFVQTRLMAALQSAGIQSQPQVSPWMLHNMLTH